MLHLTPLLDTAPYREAIVRRDALRAVLAKEQQLAPKASWIAVVAMMRAGDKLSSYRVLAKAMERLDDLPWQLLVAGGGAARAPGGRMFGRRARLLRAPRPPRGAPVLPARGGVVWAAGGDGPPARAGRAALQGFQIPKICSNMGIVPTPLAGCVETAALLGAPRAGRGPRIAEMSWGEWEGRRLAGLRRALGAAMQENEARGGDFRPPGGESPREVLARVQGWMSGLEGATLAVTHRGGIRAIFSAAAGWDLVGKPPAKLDWAAGQLFRLGRPGPPALEQLNPP